MSTASSPINQVEVLARLIDMAGTPMSAEIARYFLDLKLSDQDRHALDALAEKARHGTLTPTALAAWSS